MNKKLIFFDIDGTLITEEYNHYVPESTTLAIKQLRENGHICIINTGRPYAGLDDVIRSIDVDGYICGCGIYVRIGENVLLSHHLEKDLCYKIIRGLEDCRLEWLLEGEKAIYYSNKKYISFIGNEAHALDDKLPGIVHCISEADFKDIQFDKFILNLAENCDFERFRSMFSDVLTFIDRGNGFYELIPIGFSKATGMKFLEVHFNIDHADTIAVGDSSNDIPMLEYAQTGILMGGASKTLHKYADYVTTGIKEDGIFNAFKHYKMI